MTSPGENSVPRPFYERFLRFVIVGAFTLIVWYLRGLAAILKMGINAIRKIPMDRKKPVDSSADQ